jgi:hypothetical protein
MTRKKQTSQTQDIGRPPIYDEPMKLTSIFLPIPMHNWLKARTVPMSIFVRDLIANEMEKDKRIEEPQKKASK